MDEFIREVDDEYRRERVAQIWRRYGGLIVAAAICLVIAIGGWRYWQHREQGRAEAAGARFEEALRQLRDNQGDEGRRTLEELAGTAPAGYGILTRFRLAGETGRTEAAAGARAFDAIAADGAVDATLRDLARLRGAILRLDEQDPTAAERELERLATPNNAWRHTAREMVGLSSLKRGDVERAGRFFDQIAADRETPQALRGRLEIYVALVAGGSVQPTQ